jgi:hypothetical protein
MLNHIWPFVAQQIVDAAMHTCLSTAATLADSGNNETNMSRRLYCLNVYVLWPDRSQGKRELRLVMDHNYTSKSG